MGGSSDIHQSQEDTVNDKILPYLKAYAALIGSICTGLLAVYTGDTPVGKVLTVIAVIATTVATFAVPNLDPAGEHQDESVQPDESVSYDGHGAPIVDDESPLF